MVLKSMYIQALFISFFLLIMTEACSQPSFTKYEIYWSFFHPIAAIKIKYRLPKALEVYHAVKKSKVLDSLESGGKLDAFRHTYTMAYLAKNIKIKKLKRLGSAHEKGNKWQFKKRRTEFGERADSLACDMDLRNNNMGLELGKNNRVMNAEELKQLVLKEISNGSLWYLKRNDKGEYVTCDEKPIDFSLYVEQWYIPKCLIRTNE